MTKTEKREQKQAITEGRVIRLDMGGLHTFSTVERAQERLAEWLAFGLKAEIVKR